MLVRLVLGVASVFTLVCWMGAPVGSSQLGRCVKCTDPTSTFLSPKGALPPTSTVVAWSRQDTFRLLTTTSWACSQSRSGSNCIPQAKKIQQLILTWLKSQLFSSWLLFPSVCLQRLSLTAFQSCSFLYIPLDLLYYCLQNTESRFWICGISGWELAPFSPHLLQISHFSVLLLTGQLSNF